MKIIEMEISESEEQLLKKHSKYITFLTRQELLDQLLSRVDMSQDLIKG